MQNDPSQKVLLLFTAVFCLITGCSGAPAVEPPNSTESPNISNGSESGMNEDNTTVASGSQYISSQLNEVIRASNSSDVAAENDVRFRNGTVLVVIELRSGANKSVLPENSIDFIAESEMRVQGWVPVTDLVEIAELESVAFITTPKTPRQPSLQQ